MIDFYKVKEVKHVSDLEELNKLLKNGWKIYKDYDNGFDGTVYVMHRLK